MPSDGHAAPQALPVFLRDQQRWIEEALVVEIEGDLVTLRYDAEAEEECHSWEESVRLDSIGAVSTRLSYVNRTPGGELFTAEDCPEAERLSQS
jgi:hypothetical protein